ncbi:WG repeat-containing protein [Formosa sp. 3Alg 14/1]|uniref:WG repeat-containing protein n=1 Tax=Formosa sp. 3Alg 14/1 TaxID=3382190 RepID=UPI0039BE61F9
MKNRFLLITILFISLSCVAQTKLYYDELGEFQNGYAIVKNGSKISFIDSLGQNIDIGDSKLQRKHSDYSGMQKNGLYVISEDYKNEGIKSITGDIIVQPKNSKILVKKNFFLKLDSRDSWALNKGEKIESEILNAKGEPIFKFLGDSEYTFYPISNNIIAVSNLETQKRYKLVFLDTKSETEYIFNEVVNPDNDSLIRASIESDGKIKWGFIDDRGKTVIDFMYTKPPGPFNNNSLAVVQNTDKKFGYIDKANNIAIDVNYIAAYNFENNKALVRIYSMKYVDGVINKGYRIIDNTGKKLYDLADFSPYPNRSDYYNHSFMESKKIMVLQSERSGNKSILNLDTGEITETKYYSIGKFNSGLARVYFNDGNNKLLSGYINPEGELVMVQAQKSQF